MSESLNLKDYIVTVDTEKAFDSLSHFFLLVCLKKYGYGNDFIKWIEMLLEFQGSCIINGGNTKNISNFKNVLDKAIQFPHPIYFMSCDCVHFNQS